MSAWAVSSVLKLGVQLSAAEEINLTTPVHVLAPRTYCISFLKLCTIWPKEALFGLNKCCRLEFRVALVSVDFLLCILQLRKDSFLIHTTIF